MFFFAFARSGRPCFEPVLLSAFTTLHPCARAETKFAMGSVFAVDAGHHQGLWCHPRTTFCLLIISDMVRSFSERGGFIPASPKSERPSFYSLLPGERGATRVFFFFVSVLANTTVFAVDTVWPEVRENQA